MSCNCRRIVSWGMLAWLPGVLLWAAPAAAAVYEVGPGKTYTALVEVPWDSLLPGDVVQVYPKVDNAPYHEKLVLHINGSEQDPITIQGVLGTGGERPILDGMNATAAGYMGTASVNAERGLIIVGRNLIGTGDNFVIENLELRNAYKGYTYYRPNGKKGRYADNAAGVFVQNGANCVIRNCYIHDNCNGIFASSAVNGPVNLVVEYSHVENNGYPNNAYVHNFYISAEPQTIQYNHIGPMLAGAQGQQYKDRGSDTVFRYNWLEGGPNGQMDLVDGGTTPADAYVYGNVIIKTNQDGNGRLVHFGADSGGSRSGTLYFAANTVITTRNWTKVFQVDQADCHVEFHNNIIQYQGSDTKPQILYGGTYIGTANGSYNWITEGFTSGGAVLSNTLSNPENDPGFVAQAAQNYHLTAGSQCRDAGTNTWVGDQYTWPEYQYVKHQAGEPRPTDAVIDVGAYEYVVGQNSPPTAYDQAVQVDKDSVDNPITLQADDPDNDPLTYIIVDYPTHGVLGDDDGDELVLYTPDSGYDGDDSFTFKAYDGQAHSNVATVSITVQAGGLLPGQATNPSPPDGATKISLSGTTLSWTAGQGADSHDVYFGTNPDPGPAEFQGNQTETTFPTGSLSKLTWYYWRIDEVNEYGTTTGVVWSFKSGAQ